MAARRPPRGPHSMPWSDPFLFFAAGVRKEAASADLGAKMGRLADKVVQTVTKDIVMPT
jgi:hypothetical protein